MFVFKSVIDGHLKRLTSYIRWDAVIHLSHFLADYMKIVGCLGSITASFHVFCCCIYFFVCLLFCWLRISRSYRDCKTGKK